MSDDRHPEPAEMPEAAPDDGGNGPSRWFSELTGVGLDWRTALVVPLLAVLSALIVGALIIALSDIDTLRLWASDPGDAFGATFTTIGEAYGGLLEGSLGGIRPISETLTRAAPLILAGLAVAIGFQAGLFNIGANGQMYIGGMFALTVSIKLDLPTVIHIPVVILAGLLGGLIWGAIPGWLRGQTGAHEVITTIMLNFIALRLVDYWLTSDFFQLPGRNDPVSQSVASTARYPKLLSFVDDRARVHLGFLIAIAAAMFVYWLLFKTTWGYEFRAVGYNPHGAKYAGMSVVLLYVAVMGVAGAMAGLGGADLINGTLGRATPAFVGVIGFDAIALALLGRSHPIGVVFAGLLFGGLTAGGQRMQVAAGVGIDIVTVIQALIIVFIAAPALIRAIYRVKTRDVSEPITTGWST